MAESKIEEGRLLNHFAAFAATEAFWESPQQGKIARELAAALRDAATVLHWYRIYPARDEADFLVWSALPSDGGESAGKFFHEFARSLSAFRRYFTPVEVLWGFTRSSDYGSGRSAQEIDPFAPDRKPYLIIYPFAKTTEWYLMSRDARQGMMNEHIRIGREFPEIMQLLLYSTGLQDQEFVVAYETDNLARFSGLVSALRDTEARRYTLRDTPIYTAIHLRPEQLFVGDEGAE